MTRLRAVWIVLAMLWSGCDSDRVDDAGQDASKTDASKTDASDLSTVDAGVEQVDASSSRDAAAESAVPVDDPPMAGEPGDGLAVVYFEDFATAGKPAAPTGDYWYLVNDIYPSQGGWPSVAIGDGVAKLVVDHDTGNDTDASNPYQIIAFGTVGPGHRISVRMKGAVVPGLVSFLFTYQEDTTFDEIDIELVADDTATPPDGHATAPPDGWTDARFNSYGNSSVTTYQPETSKKQRVKAGSGEDVSLMDDEFHVYVIDWYTDRIDFWIDGVLQATITDPVPDSESEVLIGFRDLVWAGPFTWTGQRTAVIDWFRIAALEP